jgi:hypothetical protein
VLSAEQVEEIRLFRQAAERLLRAKMSLYETERPDDNEKAVSESVLTLCDMVIALNDELEKKERVVEWLEESIKLWERNFTEQVREKFRYQTRAHQLEGKLKQTRGE